MRIAKLASGLWAAVKAGFLMWPTDAPVVAGYQPTDDRTAGGALPTCSDTIDGCAAALSRVDPLMAAAARLLVVHALDHVDVWESMGVKAGLFYAGLDAEGLDADQQMWMRRQLLRFKRINRVKKEGGRVVNCKL